jgi:aminoglycoside phosphotransferase (APT) family kinase protein
MARDLESICAALARHLPGGERIEAVVPLNTGFSNETYLIKGLDAILRLPPGAGAMLDGHDVIGQARIYAELGNAPNAPPVPRIVTLCEDEAVIGMPFFVMERVEGASIDDLKMQPWFVEGSDALRQQVCRDWVSAFASLARMQPLPGLGSEVTPEDDARMWQAFALKADCPRLVAMFDRLLVRPAPRSGPPAVVHGDTKLSNSRP